MIWCIDQKMHMRRPHRMSPQRHDHLTNRTVGRDRIAAWQDGAEEEPAARVGDEASPRRWSLRLIIRLLRIVPAVFIGVPDIHVNIRQWFARVIGYTALHE